MGKIGQGDILLIGGMGSGKTALARALVEASDLDVNYLYSSLYNVRIPLMLIKKDIDMLSLSRQEFIETVRKNTGIETEDFPRDVTDKFGEKLSSKYGETFFAEVMFGVRDSRRNNLFDNMPGVDNVRYLKDLGVYVVGLRCSFDNQVQRRIKDRKAIDPVEREDIILQVRKTNDYFNISHTVELANYVVDTDDIRSDDESIVQRILSEIRDA